MLVWQLSQRAGLLILTAPILATYASVKPSEQIAERQYTMQTTGRWLWLEALGSVLVINKIAIWESKLF